MTRYDSDHRTAEQKQADQDRFNDSGLPRMVTADITFVLDCQSCEGSFRTLQEAGNHPCEIAWRDADGSIPIYHLIP